MQKSRVLAMLSKKWAATEQATQLGQWGAFVDADNRDDVVCFLLGETG
jgi:hypothetical protein